MKDKTIFLGVDQTGAVDRSGVPKVLPACVLNNKSVSFVYLKSFSKTCIEETLNLSPTQKIIVCVDCVLGLPQELNLPWRKAIELIKSSEGYGRNAAQKFFSNLGQGQILYREVERKAGANSVFKERPFQKNIQTGTYRIWKDISKSAEDFAVPFLNESLNAGKIPLYEGYPSLSWKLLFNVKSRTPEKLAALVLRYFPDLDVPPTFQKAIMKDLNLADAFVLALSPKEFSQKPIADKSRINEGWILGQKA